MRIIDADALKQKYTMATTRYSGGIMERPVVVLEAIDDAPSIDICFCKECVKHKTHRCHMAFDLIATEDNDFCSYGEREGE